MPGLLRGVARTAVVAGTATAVSNRVSRRQANRWSRQRGAAVCASSRVTSSRRHAAGAAYGHCHPAEEAAELKAQGIVTEAEFTAGKAKILAS